MATVTLPTRRRNYLNTNYGILSWLLTTDHKRIAMLYLMVILVFFIVGGAAAGMIRLELLTPEANIVTPDDYNKIFTAHGVVMIFFFLLPAIPAILGNFLIPIMVGAKDLAFPKVNLASWYVFVIAGVIGVYALLMGGVDTGWTFYTPYSTTYASTKVIPVLIAGFIAGFSSIMTALNFIVTVHRMRAPGMTWFRLPLFVWSIYSYALVVILATPVLSIALALVAIERIFQVGFFDPALGGDPLLYQHLFWYYSHPAVYIMILPGFAVMSELVANFSRKPIFGYKFVAMASVAIAALGFMVWAHHMFVAGISTTSALVFSFLTFLVAVPSAIKVFNWTGTMYKASISLKAPMIYALGFLVLFLVGGLTGLFLASLAVDVHVTDTYFIVAHFHYVMVGATVMALYGGLHYWWPKMTGRMYNEPLAIAAAILIVVGFTATFMPQFVVGYMGMPRRYATYPPEFQIWNVLSSAGATILAVGYGLPMLYFVWSLFKGEKASMNPWGASGLEWEIASPPTTFNFEKTPIVEHGPYYFSGPIAPNLFEDDKPKAGPPLVAPAATQPAGD